MLYVSMKYSFVPSEFAIDGGMTGVILSVARKQPLSKTIAVCSISPAFGYRLPFESSKQQAVD